jgi:hypothetical protein
MAELTRSQFLDQVMQLLAQRFPHLSARRHDQRFAVLINGCWVGMENLYRSTLQDPESLERSLDRWIVELLRAAEGMPDLTASFDELRERILPVVVPKSAAETSLATMLTQPFLEQLAIAYAIDSQRTLSYIAREHFAGWKMSLDDLHETALTNLVSRSDPLTAHAGQDDEGRVNLVIIQSMDGYDASRILLRGLHDRLREHLGSPFLAGIPNRDILICFRNEPEMVQRVSEQIRDDYARMPHQISPAILLVTADGVAQYE